ncbi:DoxX family protein [Nocardia cyriacigeorgica]|uniref:DoxX family protein n=1 Tax=Nocardia cyriacigeorgica TaxID=135487 RepID=UPI002454BDCE|nr:DoxX family protein [Nocardia cyriacigeorgica]
MDVALWIASGLLAAGSAGAGAMKLAVPHEKLSALPNMSWAQPMDPAAVKAIGAVEVIGAAGVILPQATGIATPLTPLAAAGLAVVGVAAGITHIRRAEYMMAPVNTVLIGLAAFVAVGRLAQRA